MKKQEKTINIKLEVCWPCTLLNDKEAAKMIQTKPRKPPLAAVRRVT